MSDVSIRSMNRVLMSSASMSYKCHLKVSGSCDWYKFQVQVLVQFQVQVSGASLSCKFQIKVSGARVRYQYVIQMSCASVRYKFQVQV